MANFLHGYITEVVKRGDEKDFDGLNSLKPYLDDIYRPIADYVLTNHTIGALDYKIFETKYPECVDNTFSGSNIKALYTQAHELVSQNYIRRTLYRSNQDIDSGNDIYSVIDALKSISINKPGNYSSFTLGEEFEPFTRLIQGNIKLGLSNFDAGNGVKQGDFITCYGVYGGTKSTLSAHIALYQALSGRRVLVVPHETGHYGYTLRMFGMLYGMSQRAIADSINSGKETIENYKRKLYNIKKYIESKNGLVMFTKSVSPSYYDILSTMQKNDIEVLIVDTFKDVPMATEMDITDLYQKQGKISNMFRDLCSVGYNGINPLIHSSAQQNVSGVDKTTFSGTQAAGSSQIREDSSIVYGLNHSPFSMPGSGKSEINLTVNKDRDGGSQNCSYSVDWNTMEIEFSLQNDSNTYKPLFEVLDRDELLQY